ncbi:hypothetical protein TVAG_361560 [Trichomonas vaginalis G3]|uniref:Uncharacterized protein n=1 Tax=Trichomonas vaginalis (strain ATCC PRA-98 / G3) TaxID=412133 RepID=A2FQN3_TRIV3|nr:hypothetical protein TVAGG3_0255280 [Trichomonas vaginalis G3]EAX92776.1 hypothetical protein TVAG_361560 [Trichomonas vaginalis G3]KAI5524682.1 hypothetical protein TVAGG3_0255280 [Trichomonas vaginalis G3]|eukprot:XP_001305706.1 hypothetical protein [Trichomonas vaginalis G3]
MISSRSKSSEFQNYDVNDMYQTVLSKRDHSGFLNDIICRNSETLSTNLVDIQRIARQNSILTSLADDEMTIATIIPLKNIFDSFQDKVNYFYTLVNDPQLLQNVAFYVKGAYRKPKEFANAALQYFRQEPKEYNLFACVLFPSISGYFIAEEHLTFAYEFLNYLIQLGEIEFARPLIASFFSSSILFIETFWQNFMTKAAEIRNRPSLKQLYDILISTLSITIRYLSPFHTALSMDLLTSDPNCFCQVFFLKVLLQSFTTYASSNPLINTVKVSKTQILQLFNFICNNTDTKSFDMLANTFGQSVSSLCEPTSFVEYTVKGAIPYIFSPVETVLAVNIFKQMPTFEGSKIDVSRLQNYSRISSFKPGVIDVYFPLPPKLPVTAVLFCDDNITVGEPPKEISRQWLSLSKMAGNEGLDPLNVIMQIDNLDQFDTPKKLEIRKYASQMITDELKKYAVEAALSNLIQSEQLFETCLVRLTQKSRLIEISDSQNRFGSILNIAIAKKLTFLPADCPRNVLLPSLAILDVSNEEDQKLYDLLEQKEVFDRVARKITRKEQKYKNFVRNNEEKLENFARIMDSLDEKSLGERMWVIAEVVNSLSLICESDDWLMTLFFFVIARSNSTCFLHTYIGINAFKALQQVKFAQLPRRLQDAWAKLSKQVDILLKQKRLFTDEFIEKYSMFVK